MSDEPVAGALPLRAAYEFAAAKGLEGEIAKIREMEIEWDSSYTSTVRRGYILEVFEQRGILEDFLRQHWQFGLTQLGQGKREFYLRIKSRFQDFVGGRVPEEADQDPGDGEQQQFVAEADLRNVLAGNLEAVEPGLRLFERDGRRGVEFPVDDGRIDVLAVDRHGKFVVIELKLSRGRNRAVGQILYYMAWVDAHLGNAPCRGMIIAREIPEDLKLAAKRAPGVSLRRYRLSVAIESTE